MVNQIKHTISVTYKKFKPIESSNDRDRAFEAVKQNGENLLFLEDIFRGDKEIVMEALKNYGNSLQFTSDELKNDKEVVLEAVKQRGMALIFASEELKNNKEVVLEAVINTRFAIDHASKELQELCKNKDPVMAIKTEIASEYANKLQGELIQKQELKPTKRMKL